MDTTKPELRDVLRLAQEAAEKSNISRARLEILIDIAKEQVKAGYSDDAEKSFELAKQTASVGSGPEPEERLALLATAQAQAGYFKDAIENAELIPARETQADAFLNIAKALKDSLKPD